MSYQTISGDTFDLIAHRVYGDCRRVLELMQANPAYLDTLVFSAGITLAVPALKEENAYEELPPWRRAG